MRMKTALSGPDGFIGNSKITYCTRIFRKAAVTPSLHGRAPPLRLTTSGFLT